MEGEVQGPAWWGEERIGLIWGSLSGCLRRAGTVYIIYI